MNLTFTRKKLLWIGVGIISFYYLLNKFEFIFKSARTQGVVVGYADNGRVNAASIEFEVQSKFYYFEGQKNVEYDGGEKLPVIYLKEDPKQAYVFSFLGFWYTGLIVALIPLMLWCAFVLSFYRESDSISLRFFQNKNNSEAVKKQSDSKTLN